MLNCSFKPNTFLSVSATETKITTFCVLPLTICQYTRRGSHGNRATSSASPHRCSHRNRSDTCQSISRGESASAAVNSDVLLWVGPAVGLTECFQRRRHYGRFWWETSGSPSDSTFWTRRHLDAPRTPAEPERRVSRCQSVCFSQHVSCRYLLCLWTEW